MNDETLSLDAAKAALDAHRGAFEPFARHLAEHNRTTNLTRIDSPEEIWNRHFLDALAALPLLDEIATATEAPFSLIDVGSGAGFPGLALAIVRPGWHIVSLEATDKKVRFQQHICDTLGLRNTEVRHGRAETVAHDSAMRERFAVAAARAVAGLDVLAELTMAFVRQGGRGVFWKGPKVREEIALAEGAFGIMGAAVTRLSAYALPEHSAEASGSTLYLAVAEKQGLTPPDYPRHNFAAIRKRPLRQRPL
jgi:16S rRNA (guanine527-N7)-methyltransferase